MTEVVSRSALVQGGLRAFAKLGLNLEPWLERQRSRINRPVSLLVETEISTLRETLASQDAAWREELRAVAAEAEAAEQRLRAKVAILGQLEAVHEKRASALEAQLDVLNPILMHLARNALDAPASPVVNGAPEVSVIMPVRDRAGLVGHAMRSVLAQRGVGLELLVVDDGSTDGTSDEVAQLIEEDSRVRLFRTASKGQSAARNMALAAARGQFFAYLDSDNVWLPGFLEEMVEAFRADPDLQAAYGLLLADDPAFDGQSYLWRPFDQPALEKGNFIDLNTYVHRRGLYEACGGFDEAMVRLVDWDLILRHSDRATPRRVPTAAAVYRSRQQDRVTLCEPHGPSLFQLRRKRRRAGQGQRAPRVLYAVWHYPQLTESYIETELRCMQRLGAEIEVWSQENVASFHEPAVPFRRGNLEDAIAAFRPDIVHVHWLGLSGTYAPEIAKAGLPMTIRAHGFEVSAEGIAAALDLSPMARLYLFPGMAASAPPDDPRVQILRAAFDTQLFRPARLPKDRRLVLRTGAALASKDYGLFFEAAARLPDHRFVLVVGTCLHREGVPDELRALNQRFGGHAEILVDVPREQVAELMERAGLYLHTALPPGQPDATPIGAPISIAEAMATGAQVLVRDLPPLAEYVGEAGATYADVAEVEGLIRATSRWDDAAWSAAGRAALDRAWSLHADETTLAPIYEDWCAIAAARDAGSNSLFPNAK